ncbi:hypothetical protein KIN20_001116 [Parelaphostrongylus tenuis]|uniref:Uncharacterized protein n=1 Tax=Parelaphostrongylus tenuis TaxID=148309 RepID=A0AAD5MER0_PARTN|nr:hypothetical protein KIN20_001116 [Parelaphostrongylus tenuis]
MKGSKYGIRIHIYIFEPLSGENTEDQIFGVIGYHVNYCCVDGYNWTTNEYGSEEGGSPKRRLSYHYFTNLASANQDKFFPTFI